MSLCRVLATRSSHTLGGPALRRSPPQLHADPLSGTPRGPQSLDLLFLIQVPNSSLSSCGGHLSGTARVGGEGWGTARKKRLRKKKKKNRDLVIFKVHPNFPGEGGWRVGQPSLCKLHLKKKRRSIQLTGDQRCWTPSSLLCRTSAGTCCPRCPR